jgi:hypothetical protein
MAHGESGDWAFEDSRKGRRIAVHHGMLLHVSRRNTPVCGGSFPHSFLEICAHGRNRASSRETLGNTHVAPKDSHTVAWKTRDSASTTYIQCQWHLRTTLPRQRQNLSDIWPDFPANLPLFPHGPSETCRSLAEYHRIRRGGGKFKSRIQI